ncbi:unnamed protein product [Brachionus calyciflorus]|uniref:Uncharacterized protein n=1 Tax=Brachionus calyciflorus TaxID=104777 RepID=A0A814H6V8_9BILA|nr:unnamed protein product [Brachionus calyciflorus]
MFEPLSQFKSAPVNTATKPGHSMFSLPQTPNLTVQPIKPFNRDRLPSSSFQLESSQPQSLTSSAQATPLPTKTYSFSEINSSARGNKRGSESKLSNEVSNAPDPKKPNKNPKRKKNQKDHELSENQNEKEASKLLNLNPSN